MKYLLSVRFYLYFYFCGMHLKPVSSLIVFDTNTQKKKKIITYIAKQLPGKG